MFPLFSYQFDINVMLTVIVIIDSYGITLCQLLFEWV